MYLPYAYLLTHSALCRLADTLCRMPTCWHTLPYACSGEGRLEYDPMYLPYAYLLTHSALCLLMPAAAKGDLNMIRNLVAKGASVDACDYDRRSALHLAAAEGHEKVVDYLIRHKVS